MSKHSKMSFDTSWDVDKYKTEFESEDHWKLRRDFMVTHKNKFPEQRLVCLAQVFFNVEFLGCRYPEKTMKLIDELSKDVAAEHREQQKTKLQRTFVCASDAAGAKVKGVKPTSENASNVETSPEKKQKTVNLENSNSVFFKDTIGNRFEMSPVHSSKMNWNTSASDYTDQPSSITSRGCNKFEVQGKNITMEEIRRTTRPFGNVVIFWKVGESPANAIERTARQWGKKYECTVKGDSKGLWVGSINFENVELAKYVGSDKMTVRKKVGQIALNKLRRSYFTVKIKCNFCGGDEVVKTTGIEKIDDPSASDKNSSNPDSMESSDVNVPIQDDNIGNKLLKMMGWSGGGLGKDQQGIIEPIKPNDAQNKRAGFGSAARDVDNEVNINRIKKIIRDYRFSSDLNDLVFSSEFSKEQRSIYHKYAIKLGLKTKSYGGKKEENRHLVISKRIDNWTIIDGLVKNVDQFFNKYELIRPGEDKGDDDCD